jgi:MFS superfamily sulfate permease-like transporter
LSILGVSILTHMLCASAVPVVGSIVLSPAWRIGDLLHPGVAVSAIFPQLLGPAGVMAALALTQSILVSEGARSRGATPVHLTREGLAQAIANGVSALTCGFPVAASVNRSLAHEQAGATSWRSAVLMAALVLVAVVIARPVLAILALPALSAMLCVPAAHMVRGVEKDGKAGVALGVAAVCVMIGFGAAVILAIGLGLYSHAVKERRRAQAITPAEA